MTPARQPQQEYIITEEQLTNLILDLEYRRYNLARITQDQIRSRPASAPEVCEEQDACRSPAMCPEATKAAKSERERARQELLKDLQTFIDDADSHIGCPQGTLGTAYLVRWMGGQGWDCD